MFDYSSGPPPKARNEWASLIGIFTVILIIAIAISFALDKAAGRTNRPPVPLIVTQVV